MGLSFPDSESGRDVCAMAEGGGELPRLLVCSQLVLEVQEQCVYDAAVR